MKTMKGLRFEPGQRNVMTCMLVHEKKKVKEEEDKKNKYTISNMLLSPAVSTKFTILNNLLNKTSF